jgi:exodeoxyribonuclease VIII
MNARTDMTLGLHPTMPAEKYHAIAAMSAGGLKRMRQSPAHFFGLQIDPARPPANPTPAMFAGTLAHCAMFEPKALAERYVVKPAGMKFTTKDGMAWRDAQTLEIVDSAQLATAQAQADAVRALPDVAALLADGMPEASAFWIDDATGELCKCRPDWVSPAGDGVVLVDGKTAQDASPDGFGRAIWNFAYHLQAAWYSDGYEAATGKHVLGFVFAAVESAWPHVAAAYMLGDDVLWQARRENRRLLNLYAECKRTGVWPGYAADIQPISLPAWANRGD